MKFKLKIHKALCLIIALCFSLNLVAFAQDDINSMSNTLNTEKTYYLQENFESAEVGDLPDGYEGWTLEKKTANETIVTEETEGNKYLTLTSSGKGNNVAIYKQFENIASGKVVVEFDYIFQSEPTKDGTVRLLTMYEDETRAGTGRSILITSNKNQKIIYNGTSMDEIIEVGKLYQFKLYVDIDAHTYDFYLNNELVAEDIAFTYPTSIGCFETKSDSAKFSIDNIAIYSEEDSGYVPEATSIEIAGNQTISLLPNEVHEETYTAQIKDQMGNPFEGEVEWSLVESGLSGISIDSATGKLTIRSSELTEPIPERITIKAQMKNSELATTYSISIQMSAQEASKISIRGETAIEIQTEDKSYSYQAIAKDSEGNPVETLVSWSIAPSDQGVSVDAKGNVTVAASAQAGEYILTAASGSINADFKILIGNKFKKEHLLYEDFQDKELQLGDLPAGYADWKQTKKTDSEKIIVEQLEDNKYLTLTSLGSNTVALSKEFASLATGKAVIEFDYIFDTLPSTGTMRLLTLFKDASGDASGRSIFISADKNQKIKYNGTSMDTLFEIGKLYHFQLNVDLDAHSFDFYVNNELIAEKVAFMNNVSIGRFETMSNSACTYSIDNIAVYRLEDLGYVAQADSIEIAGSQSISLLPNEVHQETYTAQIKDQMGNPFEGEVEWSLVESGLTGIGINATTGVLTIDSKQLTAQIPEKITVKAQMKGGNLLATYEINLGMQQIGDIEIVSEDQLEIKLDQEVQLTFKYILKDQFGGSLPDDSAEVVWSIESEEPWLVLNGNVLTVKGSEIDSDDQFPYELAIKATVNDISKTKNIVCNLDSTGLELGLSEDTIPSVVTDDFELPTAGDYGSTITWESGNTSVITIRDNKAEVTRKNSDVVVKLRATFELNGQKQQKDFEVKVKGKSSGSSGGSSGGSSSSGSGSSPSKGNTIYVPSDFDTSDNDHQNQEAKVVFQDLDQVEWAKTAVEYLHEKGIVNGVGDNMFLPMKNVTRAEFIHMLLNGLGMNDADAVCTFQDVSENDWYYNSVAAAEKLNIIKGYENNLFMGNQTITREEMAVMLYRTLEVKNMVETDQTLDNDYFSDFNEISDYAKQAILQLHEMNIFQGNENKASLPKMNATRAEAAMLIYRAITF